MRGPENRASEPPAPAPGAARQTAGRQAGDGPSPIGRRHLLAAFLAISLLAAGLYLVTLPYDLVWDDTAIVKEIDAAVGERGLAGLLSSGFLVSTPVELNYYRPLVNASFWFDSAIAGRSSRSYHLTNILLHGANSGLVFLLLAQLLSSLPAAVLGALLFAAHPVHLESVAFVSGRTDLWAALFLLLATVAWLRGRSEGRAPSAGALSGGALAFLCACLSKETSFLLPAVLLAWDALAGWRREPGPPRDSWWLRNGRWLGGWGLAVATALSLRWFVAGIGPPRGLPNTIAAAVHLWLGYARLLLLPWPHKVYYADADLTPGPLTLLAAAALAYLYLAPAWRSRSRLGLIGLVWTAGFLLPVGGPYRPDGAVLAERFLYVPSVGLSLAAGYFLLRCTRSPGQRRVAAIAAAAVTLAMGFAIVRGAAVWKNEVTLFSSAAQATRGRVPQIHYNLGLALKAAGRPEEAFEQFRKALALEPAYAPARYQVANALRASGRREQAVAEYQKTIADDPRNRDAHFNLALTYGELFRLQESKEAYLKLIAFKPDDYRAYSNLGHTLISLGQWAEAREMFRQASRIRPGEPLIHLNLGIAHAHFHQWDEAIVEFKRAVDLDGNHVEAHYQLGAAYLMRKEPDRAAREAAVLARLSAQKARQLSDLIQRETGKQ